MAVVIGTHNYTYGAGNQPNRQIQFSRTGVEPATIQAQVFVLAGGLIGTQTSTVPGTQINVEMEGTTQKMQRMMQARAQFQDFNPLPDQLLSNLTLAQQNGIMQSLANRSVEVANVPGVPGGQETVSSLKIVNPT